jgi:hypothetical protein
MIESLSATVNRYRHRGILVDSSLLVVFLVGSFDRDQLANCRSIKSSFTPAEFDLLANVIARFDALVTTPHILTEVSNLAGKLPGRMHAPFRTFFASLMSVFQEETVTATGIAAQPIFIKLGITDSAITMIAPGRYLVLTEDVRLYSLLSKQGVDVVNFSHIREMA